MLTKIWEWIKGLFVKSAPQYQCPYCNKKYKTIDEVNSHIQQKHTGERMLMDINWN